MIEDDFLTRLSRFHHLMTTAKRRSIDQKQAKKRPRSLYLDLLVEVVRVPRHDQGQDQETDVARDREVAVVEAEVDIEADQDQEVDLEAYLEVEAVVHLEVNKPFVST